MGIFAAFKTLSWGARLAFLGTILALLLAVGGGLYYTGYTKGNNNSKIAIANYQTDIAKLETKIKNATAKVDIRYVTEYKDRVAYVDRTEYVNRDVIKYRVPEQFKFSNGWVYAYNQSIAGLPIDPDKASDGTASWVSDRTGLTYISQNNGICLANAQQLDSVIATLKAREEARNEANK